MTDIEGSTELWERDAMAMAAALARHDELIEIAVTAHGGQFVKSRGEGDSTFSVFESPGNAIAGALAVQTALRNEQWTTPDPVRVRVALHTGEAEARDGDYFGPTVNRCARLRSIAHGGQTICSQATADLVADDRSSTLALHDLGRHRLKSLERPEQVFQVSSGQHEEFPPLRSDSASRTNVPAQRTTFVGRGDEIAVVEKHLAARRLVTLTGVGGCGKTRLAIELATRCAPRFANGATFVDLSPVGDASGVASTIAAAVGIAVTSEVVSELLAALAEREMLLVIDNCEHVIDAAADVIDQLLAGTERLKILATSREALEIDGEQTHTVRSLSVPGEGDDPEDSEAVRLFCDRAAAVRDDFQLSATNAADIGEICRHLDGMPLAIELAAAQVAHLSPRQIVERLDERLTLLAGGRRRVQRQQTLAAALDWSHELLPDEEQTLFRRLAVFTGSFTLEAVEQICAFDLSLTATAAMHALVNKSLVVLDDHGAAVRYRLLETVRLYADERLVAAGEAEQLRDRHRDHLLAWLESLPVDAQICGDLLLMPEQHNLRAAVDWSYARQRPDLVARLASRMVTIWDLVDPLEGVRWFEVGWEAADQLTPDQRVALLGAWSFIAVAGLTEPEEDRSRRLRLLVELAEDRPGLWTAVAYSLLSLAQAREAFEGKDVRDVIERYGTRAIELATTTGARMFALTWFGHARSATLDFDGALAATEEALQLALEIGARDYAGYQCAVLSLLHHITGELDRARDEAEAALAPEIFERQYNTSLYVSLPLPLAFAAAGDHDDAIDLLRRNIDDAPSALTAGTLPGVVNVLAAITALQGDWRRAASLLGSAREAFERGMGRNPIDILLYGKYAGLAHKALGDEFDLLHEQGLQLPLPDALALGFHGRA